MSTELTKLQSNILNLADTRDLAEMTLREIAEIVGANHPYSVQQAIESLVKKGKLVRNLETGILIASHASSVNSRPLLSIPILGRVSCGPATEMAPDKPLGFISLSPTSARVRKPDITYALVAMGNSMTAAKINNKPVEDGDYVIVQKSEWGNANEGDYVVSRFDGVNNLKKLHVDKPNRRVVLLSESNDEFPPIFIDEQDMDYYAIEGIAIDIVKGVKV